MRHVIGLVLAVILAAVLFGGAGWGTWRLMALHAVGTSLTGKPGLLAVAALAGTGLLLGLLLVVPAVSPLAAGLPGLALLAWSVLLVVSTARADRLIPPHSHAAIGLHTLLTSGVLAVLGVVMIVPLFVPSRWRRRHTDHDAFSRPSANSLLQ